MLRCSLLLDVILILKQAKVFSCLYAYILGIVEQQLLTGMTLEDMVPTTTAMSMQGMVPYVGRCT